jgi:hypothetical protein
MIHTLLLLIAFLLPPTKSSHRIEVLNLSQQFQVYSEGRYVSADSVTTLPKTLFLFVEANRFKGNFLELASRKGMAIFINGSLVNNFLSGTKLWNLDSLSRVHSSSLALALYRDNSAEPVQAKIISFSLVQPTSLDPVKRQGNYFNDFSTIASGLLIICFTLLIRANSRLTLDYFNFIKLFSLQERDENLLGTKISASFNLLIYVFLCFLLAYLLLIINYYSGHQWNLIRVYESKTVFGSLVDWFNLSTLLSAILLLKLIVVYSFSGLFNFGDMLTSQFFNFIRLLFLACALTILFLVSYLVLKVDSDQSYLRLFYFFIASLALWIPIVFLKLLGRASYGMFHLFSYLCPTEIFPVLVLIKALFL